MSFEELVTRVVNNHPELLQCGLCRVTVMIEDIIPLPASTCLLLRFHPFAIAQAKCKCETTNLPFYVCLQCNEASGQSTVRRGYATSWLERHAESENHRQHGDEMVVRSSSRGHAQEENSLDSSALATFFLIRHLKEIVVLTLLQETQ